MDTALLTNDVRGMCNLEQIVQVQLNLENALNVGVISKVEYTLLSRHIHDSQVSLQTITNYIVSRSESHNFDIALPSLTSSKATYIQNVSEVSNYDWDDFLAHSRLVLNSSFNVRHASLPSTGFHILTNYSPISLVSSKDYRIDIKQSMRQWGNHQPKTRFSNPSTNGSEGSAFLSIFMLLGYISGCWARRKGYNFHCWSFAPFGCFMFGITISILCSTYHILDIDDFIVSPVLFTTLLIPVLLFIKNVNRLPCNKRERFVYNGNLMGICFSCTFIAILVVWGLLTLLF